VCHRCASTACCTATCLLRGYRLLLPCLCLLTATVLQQSQSGCTCLRSVLRHITAACCDADCGALAPNPVGPLKINAPSLQSHGRSAQSRNQVPHSLSTHWPLMHLESTRCACAARLSEHATQAQPWHVHDVPMQHNLQDTAMEHATDSSCMFQAVRTSFRHPGVNGSHSWRDHGHHSRRSPGGCTHSASRSAPHAVGMHLLFHCQHGSPPMTALQQPLPVDAATWSCEHSAPAAGHDVLACTCHMR
jgi:hypothetical protein